MPTAGELNGTAHCLLVIMLVSPRSVDTREMREKRRDGNQNRISHRVDLQVRSKHTVCARSISLNAYLGIIYIMHEAYDLLLHRISAVVARFGVELPARLVLRRHRPFSRAVQRLSAGTPTVMDSVWLEIRHTLRLRKNRLLELGRRLSRATKGKVSRGPSGMYGDSETPSGLENKSDTRTNGHYS